MQLAMIGLGRMGGNMVQRLLQGGQQVVVFDQSAAALKPHVAMGAKGAKDLTDLCGQLESPRVVWVMVPAGAAVENTIDQLLPGLSRGDIIIDGGNSNYKDSIRRAARLKEKGL
jgi:6-phosphogluconate dehydrogenase